jgi:hypothetical protein
MLLEQLLENDVGGPFMFSNKFLVTSLLFELERDFYPSCQDKGVINLPFFWYTLSPVQNSHFWCSTARLKET